jgi:hypothetical protein
LARQQQANAQQAFNTGAANAETGQNITGTAGRNASTLYNQLYPLNTAMAAGAPTPGTTAENTAAQQSIGGSTAGAVGEGNLEAARTRNAGSFQPAEDEAVRSGQRDLSQTAEGVKANEVNQGQSGLSSLFGSQESQQLGGLGASNAAVNSETGATNAGTTAGNSGWFQNLTGVLGMLAKPASDAYSSYQNSH